MTNKPLSTARDAEGFVEFAEASALGPQEVITKFGLAHPRETWALLKASSKKVASLAKETYWSGSAFAWGKRPDGLTRAVKFKFAPCTVSGVPGTALPDWLDARQRPQDPVPAYLKYDLNDLLNSADPQARHNLCFEMSIQIQKDPSHQPIEDAFEAWDIKQTAFIPVAHLLIPKQRFDTPEQNDFCERLTFNVWDGIQAHRPLGDINRVRKYAYQASQEQRLQFMPRADGSTPIPGEAEALGAAVPHPGDAYWNLNPLDR